MEEILQKIEGELKSLLEEKEVLLNKTDKLMQDYISILKTKH